MQIDFLIELFEKAKKEQIHTCIDTSGITCQGTGENAELVGISILDDMVTVEFLTEAAVEENE